MAANPRGVFLLTAPLPDPPSRIMPSPPLVLPVRPLEALALPRETPLPSKAPFDAPRCSIRLPRVLDWSAISISCRDKFRLRTSRLLRGYQEAEATERRRRSKWITLCASVRPRFEREDDHSVNCGIPVFAHLCDVISYGCHHLRSSNRLRSVFVTMQLRVKGCP